MMTTTPNRLSQRNKLLLLVGLLAIIMIWRNAYVLGNGRGGSAEIEGNNSAEEEEEEDEFSKMKQNLSTKRSKKKLSLEDEAKFACDERNCVKTCFDEISCQTGYCTREKQSKCRKTCAAVRCKSRCKLEPQTSYVEREMKHEKCAAGCAQQADAVKFPKEAAKCLAKCDEEKRTCKERCKERAQRFLCVRPLSDLDGQGEEEDEASLVATAEELASLEIL